ncbi:hypothetical protein Tco_0752201 [Tanacetum coccineum]|uniref:Uncharacterized protein n=1 Tax=Tanacetum coccineum TaxID=301880 RepID=A0ABQ4Z9C7_9ASTR
MHTSRDDYLINTLRFVSTKEATQIYGVVLSESLTSPEMKETKAYNTYLGFATGATPPKKRPAKKYTKAPARGVVIRETPKMPFSKKKEKVDVARVRRKSMRDFHKTHPSRSGTVTKTAPSVAKIKPSITNEGTSVKPGFPDVTEEESSKSEAESWGNDEDDNNNEQDSNGEDSDQENDSGDDKTQPDNENESDSEHETDKNESGSESDQEENKEDIGDDEEVKDELVKTLSNDSDDEDETKITDKAEGDEDEEIDYTTKIVSHLDVQSIYELPNSKTHTPLQYMSLLSPILHRISLVTTLEKEVAELKKVPLHTQVIALVDDHIDARLGATGDEFINHLSASITARITEQVVLAKESSQPQSSYEVAATLIEFELKKILIDKMDKSESYLAAHEHRECYEGLIKSYDLDKNIFSTYGKVIEDNKDAEPTKGPKAKESQSSSSKGTKSQPKSSGKSVQSEELGFEVADSNMPQDPEGNLGPAFRLFKGTRSNYAEFQYDFEECYKALLEKLDWENPEGGDYLFDLTKPIPLVMSGNRQKVPDDYFFNNDLKYLQGGVSTMNYTTSIIKTKAAQYDLPGIEDMVQNIWVPVKVVYDKYALCGISHWREQCRGNKETLFEYLKEIVVRRANNDHYRFKEGDFLRLRINEIEDMLILVVQNWLTNFSGDDVSDFAIALRMFTRSLVIQKRVEDLQLGVESYQKKIKLMRSDELYKFSDRTLIRLRTLLDDITKNIQIEYMPKRRWSTLEKKRANIMIKVIDKQLKERRMMRSLEKFVGGRHYETDLRLLQRTI